MRLDPGQKFVPLEGLEEAVDFGVVVLGVVGGGGDRKGRLGGVWVFVVVVVVQLLHVVSI